ncbi:MAG: hypothetical protein H0W64_00690 [Gammaproteobacteria bacterium]|nr:hypothetical protein [Gammaproteobacteria bacterium]
MKKHHEEKRKRMQLWKWLVVILIVLAMPLFFSYYREAQLQQVLIETAPQN